MLIPAYYTRVVLHWIPFTRAFSTLHINYLQLWIGGISNRLSVYYSNYILHLRLKILVLSSW